MFDPSQFTTPEPKPLPIILLLDVSTSMSGDKIDSLNEAVREMITSFQQLEQLETEILLSIITFGDEVSLHTPYSKPSQIQWRDLTVSGWTPMGVALKMAKAMIEDKKTTPSRAYRPTIILVSDGEPTDEWEQPMFEFISSGRSAKCDRMAMAIGEKANKEILEKFIDGTKHQLFTSHNASQLNEFFQKVTMSVTSRTCSQDPNKVETSIVQSSDTTKTNDSDRYW